MRRSITLILGLTLGFGLVGCLEEDFFGLSSFGEIKDLQVTNQASVANINSTDKIVQVEIPAGVDLTALTIQVLTLSSFAEANVAVGDMLDLTEPSTINVTAEDGTVTTWTVESFVASNTPQLANSDFNLWYQTSAGYFEPGESAANTIWGTGNPGSALINRIATTPLEVAPDDNAARMETLDNGSLGSIAGTPISAATIYTGVFNTDNIDLNDPEAAIDFGTPFAGRPDAFELLYQFEPGPENKDRSGQVLDFDDQCDIYMLLEVRDGSTAKRLATGWFRSSETIAELTMLRVEMTYGPLDATFPPEANPEDGFVSVDSVGFILPTHLTFVATSSFDGANFAGAVGSTLIIDDLDLIYEE